MSFAADPLALRADFYVVGGTLGRDAPSYVARRADEELFGLLACFAIMWLVSSIAALAVVLGKDSIPDGVAPYVVLLCVFMLANFVVVLCGALHALSEAMTSAVIIVTNMGVSIFMFTVGPLPGINAHLWGPTPVWNATFWTVLGCELTVLAIAFILPFCFAARRRDFL